MKPLPELKQICKAATPGPWEHSYRDGWSVVIEKGKFNLELFSLRFNHPANADFVATFNPSQVLSLIARIEELEKALKALVEINDRDNSGDPDRLATDSHRERAWKIAEEVVGTK